MRMADCHPDRKHNAKGLCKRCYMRQWKRNNPDKIRAQYDKWVVKNPNGNAEKARRYKAMYPERVKAKNKRWNDANRDYRENWRKNNPDKVKEYAARSRKKNPDYIKKWKAAHPDYDKIAGRRWKKLNPDKVRMYNAKAHAKRTVNKDNATVLEREWRAVLFGYQCVYCGGEYEHIDHLVALTRGGTNTSENLVPACGRCNQSKHAYPWREWYRKQSFYDPKREKIIEDNTQ